MKNTLNFKYIIKMYGYILLTIGASMALPIFTSFYYNEIDEAYTFIVTAVFSIAIGGAITYFLKPGNTLLKMRDGYFTMGSGWLIAIIIGAIPYLFSGFTSSPIAAFFESAAGFTTTCATILNTGAMPKCLIMWKAVSGWLGGLGILIFIISFLYGIGTAMKSISGNDISNINNDRFNRRFSQTSRFVYVIYGVFTIVEFCLLSIGGMGTYESAITTLCNVSTSGLIGHPGISFMELSPYLRTVIIVFTILAAISFPLYSYIIKGGFSHFLKNSEVRTFFLIIITGTLLITLNLYFSGTYSSLSDSLKYAFTEATAFSTTSGYTSINHSSWPEASMFVLSIMMMIGGCSSSTSGSIKVARVMVMSKIISRTQYKKIHPRAVKEITINRINLNTRTVSNVSSFVYVFFILLFLGSIFLSLQGYNMLTSMSAVLSILSNTGIYMGESGYLGYFGCFSQPLQLMLAALMIIGRLEIFSFFMINIPSLDKSEIRHDRIYK